MTVFGRDGPPGQGDGNDQGDGGDQSAEPYKVGYGKPPKHTQFPRGNGPGRGRPKGAKNIKTLVSEAFNVKVSAKINGKTKKLSKIELTMHQLANKASAGELKAMDKAITLHERYGPEESASGPPLEETKLDLDVLESYLALKNMFETQPPKREAGDV